MFVTIGKWDLIKTDEDDKVVKVRIVANQLTSDIQDEKMLPEAFDDETVNEFLGVGIIDWHHQSIMGETIEERAHAIIGKPYDFKWENEKPAVYADLAKSHPIVANSMIPNLEAKLPVYAGSIGGKRRKAEKIYDESTGKIINTISKIKWNHLAITGAPYVVNTAPGPQVSLVKAEGSDMLHVSFSDIDMFNEQCEILNREPELTKALEAGYETDSKLKTGADANTRQSLEGDTWSHPLKKDILEGIIQKRIPANSKAVKKYLLNNGFSSENADWFISEMNKSLNKAIKNL